MTKEEREAELVVSGQEDSSLQLWLLSSCHGLKIRMLASSRPVIARGDDNFSSDAFCKRKMTVGFS